MNSPYRIPGRSAPSAPPASPSGGSVVVATLLLFVVALVSFAKNGACTDGWNAALFLFVALMISAWSGSGRG